MSSRLAAIAALLLAVCAAARSQPSEMLTLDDAMARALTDHPDLLLFRPAEAGLAAEAERATQSPPLRLGGELENAFGSGAASNLQGSELTLTLSSVLERGGKREARLALAGQRIDALRVQRMQAELDLLAEVARRYLDLAGADRLVAIATDDVAQRQRALEAASRRVKAGTAPASTQLAAEAAKIRAELDLAGAQAQAAAAWRRLSTMWNQATDVPPPATSADLLQLPRIPGFDVLTEALRTAPGLARFADQRRIRETRLRLAETARTTDVDWSVGVRRLEAENDWGLVGSLSLPLGQRRRGGPEVRAAEAGLQALELERESAERALEATLAQAHGQFVAAAAEVERSRAELLPVLIRAEQSAERGYRAGALSYLEWSQLQAETVSTRRRQLAAAQQALLALIEIQRLIAEPFVLADVPDKDPNS